MAVDVQNRSEPSVSSLVSGIVTDVQELIKQQFQLMRGEIQEDLRKSKEAATLLAIGAGACFLGVIGLFFFVVHLLHWATSPPGYDPATVPLWAWFGIVGLVFVIVGGCLALAAREKFKSVNPMQSPATQALKENVQWLTSPK